MRLHPHLNWPRKWPAIIIALLLIGSAGLARADGVVVPTNAVSSDSVFGSGIFRAANYHAQAVYGAQLFPPEIGLLITELRYRPDYFYGRAFTTTVANIQFNLSTTTRNPEPLSPGFANNVGSDDTVVFSGPLSISSQFVGPQNGPKEFDIVIPLTTPFLYNPDAGNLLVEVRNFSGSSVASHLSGQNVAGDGASRVGGSLSSGTGSTDSGAEALQIVYIATNRGPVAPQPIQLTRGPYLQNATASNLVVRWRTSRPTNSVVQFGLTNGALTWTAANSPRTNEHIVTLTNLAPDTKYFYAVGADGTNLAVGSNYFFITPPATQRPTRIWAIGDAGSANQPYVYPVQDPFGMRDAYYAYTSNRYTDVFLMLGDNAYQGGSDDEYSTNVFGTFPTLLRQAVCWPAIGNHDTSSELVDGTYRKIFSLPQNGEGGGVPSGSELYYSFDYGNIHFVCLDSEISPNSLDSPMVTWLQQDLENNTKDWLIAYWHSPPYSYGSHDSDNAGDSGGHLVQMRENVLPVLESHGVDLVLCGHSHVYERSMLIDGHYGYGPSFSASMAKNGGSGREGETGAYLKPSAGPAEHEGAVYIVCGSSGWVTGPAVSPDRYLKHPAMYIGLDRVGSMVIDVSSNRLDAKFLRNTGAIDDYFTIRKGLGPEIKSIAFDAGNVALQFKSIPGYTYRIDRATTLYPTPDWQPASGDVMATGPVTPWTGSTNGDAVFYRVVLVGWN